MSRPRDENAQEFEQACAAHAAAAARDPRRLPVGLLAGDPSGEAIGDFLWFASGEDLFQFLKHGEVTLLQLDQPDASGIRAALDRLVVAAGNVESVSPDAITAAFGGWDKILWLGRFEDLCQGASEFASSLREEYRARRGGPRGDGPIDAVEVEAFVEFLRLDIGSDRAAS